MIRKFSLSRCVALTTHYLQSMKRNPARFIEIIVWPSFELLLFGMLALSIHNTESAALSTTVAILAGVMYWNFTARVVQESVAQFLDDGFSKNIQNLFVAPLSLLELSVGITVSSIIKLCISFTFLLGITYLFLPSFFLSVTQTHPLLLLELIIFGSILSLIALSCIFLFGVRASSIGWLISTTLQIFSCVFFERNVLPNVLYQISYIVPSSYIFETIRNSGQQMPINPHSQIIIGSLLILYFIISVSFLKFSYSYARKNSVFSKI